jgi:hypothetical protein
VEYGLIAAIFAACLLFWIATPLVALWLVSKLSDDGLVVVFGGAGIVCPVLMLGFGLVIGRLNGAYLRAVGADPARRIPAWRASVTGDRNHRRPRAVLEVSLTLSVLVAAVLLAIFFLFFAHSANPGNPGL